jgi:hypothetical protein
LRRHIFSWSWHLSCWFWNKILSGSLAHHFYTSNSVLHNIVICFILSWTWTLLNSFSACLFTNCKCLRIFAKLLVRVRITPRAWHILNILRNYFLSCSSTLHIWRREIFSQFIWWMIWSRSWTHHTLALQWFSRNCNFWCILCKILLLVILSWSWSIKCHILQTLSCSFYHSRTDSIFWEAFFRVIWTWSWPLLWRYFFRSTSDSYFLSSWSKFFFYIIISRSNKILRFTLTQYWPIHLLLEFYIPKWILCIMDIWIIVTWSRYIILFN